MSASLCLSHVKSRYTEFSQGRPFYLTIILNYNAENCCVFYSVPIDIKLLTCSEGTGVV